jgi:hypothetical protein
LREAARHLRLDAEYQQQQLQVSPEALRTDTLFGLVHDPDAQHTVLKVLPNEPAAVRKLVLQRLAIAPYWLDAKDVDVTIGRMIASDPDPKVVMQAAESLWRIQAARLLRDIDQRLAAEQKIGAAQFVGPLLDLQEQYQGLKQPVLLPNFLRRVPPIFALKPADQSVRVVAIGDFGSGTPEQAAVAESVARVHREQPFDFGVTLGDNFYPTGAHSLDDAYWQDRWERPYGVLGIPFYASFGNHDWNYYADSPAAEILYTTKSRSWRFPAPYYSYTAGSVQFFAINTQEITERQRLWLKQALETSRARWKVVYGHVPYINTGVPEYVVTRQIEALFGEMRNRADVYLAGHHHAMEHLKPIDGVQLFVSGGGGAPTYEVNRDDPRALFARQSFGFLTLQADVSTLAIRFYDASAQEIYRYSIRK